MISYQILDPKKSDHYFSQLKKENAKSKNRFSGFETFNRKLFRSDFKILDVHFECRNIIFLNQDLVIAACTHYKPNKSLKELSYPESIGNFLFSDKITNQQLKDIGLILKNLFSNNEVLLPLNGSFNLGLYENPESDIKTSFLTTEYNQKISDFFKMNQNSFTRYRTSYAMILDLNNETVQQLKAELASQQKNTGFTTRTLSRFRFFRDLQIYNRLVNESMTEHFLFFPIDWNAMKQLLLPLFLFISPRYFRFILKNGHEIGFVFAVPDYNQILSDSVSDIVNLFRCLLFRSEIKKARIVYSCLQSEYQGQKLIKQARHQVLIDLFNDGFTSVESSYVDEKNQKSVSNVKSTGAKLKQSYHLYKIQ